MESLFDFTTEKLTSLAQMLGVYSNVVEYTEEEGKVLLSENKISGHDIRWKEWRIGEGKEVFISQTLHKGKVALRTLHNALIREILLYMRKQTVNNTRCRNFLS